MDCVLFVIFIDWRGLLTAVTDLSVLCDNLA